MHSPGILTQMNKVNSVINMLQIILRTHTVVPTMIRTTGNGHQEVTAKNRIQIFGNPRDGYLTLKGENINKVEVLSVNGQIIVTNTVHPSESYFILPTDVLAEGFYLIRVYNGGSYTTLKIIIP